jgi:hypothetical protein
MHLGVDERKLKKKQYLAKIQRTLWVGDKWEKNERMIRNNICAEKKTLADKDNYIKTANALVRGILC